MHERRRDVYMAQPFLVLYGKVFHDPAYCYEESAKNKHSSFHWARAIGWFGMAAIDILEVLPADHPRRPELVGIVKFLAEGYRRFQDPRTGRWYQVVDHGEDAGNWLETSASSMYAFTVSRAIERGYLPASYASVARRGYGGVLRKVSVGSDGLTNIADICEGTNVGDL